MNKYYIIFQVGATSDYLQLHSLSALARAKVSKYIIIVRDEKHACKLHVYKP